MTLADIWFVLVAVLLTGYAVLDGFDLGAGVLYPFLGRSEDDRRVIRASIGPVWDGNEVWLVAGGGALFAAFPAVYAMTFSGFYLAIMLVLFGLILRAVALEFRHRDESWGKVWDAFFFLGSLAPALLLGVAVGNVIRGVPLNATGDYTGTFLELLNPYALLLGVTGLALFTSHGAAWIAVKAEGDLRTRAARAASVLQATFVLLAVAATVYTFADAARAKDNVLGSWAGWLMLVLLLVAVVWTRSSMLRKNDLGTFLASALSVVAVAGIAAVGNFPDMVPSRGGEAGAGLTVANSSSSDTTLGVMLIVAIIGFPLVLGYTAVVYRTFRGKVRAAPGEY